MHQPHGCANGLLYMAVNFPKKAVVYKISLKRHVLAALFDRVELKPDTDSA